MEIKIKKLHPKACVPKQATSGAAGADLCALCGEEGLVIKPMQRTVVHTGIAMELPSNEWVGLVFARSGLALNEGLTLANCVGVVDSDYRGELRVPMVNISGEDVIVTNGQRVAQRTNEEMEYLHQDYLGSTILVTDSNGNKKEVETYKPYGASITDSLSTNYQWTGGETDESGMYYFNARYYSPEIGRFISVDPAVIMRMDISTEELCNPYMYARNNPISYTDVTGFAVIFIQATRSESIVAY
jgi:dUTP pyrophosphatase